MRDDFITRDWADHHARLTGGFANALRRFFEVLERQHERQMAAPWRQPNA